MSPNLVYATLDGHAINLSTLSRAEQAFFNRCYELYRSGASSEDFTNLANLVSGPENIVVQSAGGRITRAVAEHPLFQAVRDLEDRLGIRVGELAPSSGDRSASEPLPRSTSIKAGIG